MSDYTQVEIDEAVKEARLHWESMKKESGLSDLLFNVSKQASQFLGQYQMIKDEVESVGFLMPDLVDGIKVTVKG
jgi:hypothetical protein